MLYTNNKREGRTQSASKAKKLMSSAKKKFDKLQPLPVIQRLPVERKALKLRLSIFKIKMKWQSHRGTKPSGSGLR